MKKRLPAVDFSNWAKAHDLLVKKEDKKTGDFLGLISKGTILDHYRKELKAQTEDY